MNLKKRISIITLSVFMLLTTSVFASVPGGLQTGNMEGKAITVNIPQQADRSFSLEEAKRIKAFHRFLTAEIQKIERDMVFIKTHEGTLRSFPLKEAQEEGLTLLKKGDFLTLEVDEGNLIIDIHQVWSGILHSFDAIDKKVEIQLDNGKVVAFEVKVPVLSKLNLAEKGKKIALELDEEGRVMDVFSG